MIEDFPFLNTVQTSSTENLPTFKMYDWNFTENKFKRDKNGDLILLSENDALKIWIEKMVRTERDSYLSYSTRYGTEFKKLIGKVISVGERRAELRRYLIESLLSNPYIKSVDEINFAEDKTNLEINITLTTIYGRMEV